MSNSTILAPERPLSELEQPVVTDAAPPPTAPAETAKAHEAGEDLITTATSLHLAMRQLRRAARRGPWRRETLLVAAEVLGAMQAASAGLEALSGLAAQRGGEAL